jgi:hypothetical protein
MKIEMLNPVIEKLLTHCDSNLCPPNALKVLSGEDAS